MLIFGKNHRNIKADFVKRLHRRIILLAHANLFIGHLHCLKVVRIVLRWVELVACVEHSFVFVEILLAVFVLMLGDRREKERERV